VSRRRGFADDRYSTVAIVFHWTIAALVIPNLAIGLFHDAIGGMAIHKSVGITVLALSAARVAWRLVHRPPPLPNTVPAWQRHAAHVAHWALYALLILLPLSGWAMVSGPERRPLTWFGLFDIPYLDVPAEGAEAAHGGHTVLGYLMLLLVALHVAAAFYHHLIVRDRTLVRIAPVLDQ
jgi:cytochrome b561